MSEVSPEPAVDSNDDDDRELIRSSDYLEGLPKMGWMPQ